MTDVLRLALAGTLCFAGIGPAASPRKPAASEQFVPPVTRFRQADRRILLRILRKLAPHDRQSVARLEAEAGLALVGTPYTAGTLEVPGLEHLVCNLRGLDCVTFVESSLAIALTVRQVGASAPPAASERVFEDELSSLRYRTDRPDGYASRLHYFSDWSAHNETRKVVREITRDLGGVPDDRPIDYMTAHANLYPRLADKAVFGEIEAVERALTASVRWVLPASDVAREADRLEEGDILALVPRTPGLDVSHVGLAHRASNGTVHILNAPDVGGRVEVSPLSLVEYLQVHPKIVGIRVIRPL